MASICGSNKAICEGERIHVHGEFQEKIPYEGGAGDRTYDISKLPIAAVFPDSETDGVAYQPDVKKQEVAPGTRIYRFYVARESRNIEVRYAERRFYIYADNVPVSAKAHPKNLKGKMTESDKIDPNQDHVTVIPFSIPEFRDDVDDKRNSLEKDKEGNIMKERRMLKCDVRIRWQKKEKTWAYKLTVNNAPVPCVWSSDTGKGGSSYIPDVMGWDLMSGKAGKYNIYTIDEIKKSNAEWSIEMKNQTERTSFKGGADLKAAGAALEGAEYISARVWYFVVDHEVPEDEMTGVQQQKLRAIAVARKKTEPGGEIHILVDGLQVGTLKRDNAVGMRTCEFDVRLTGPENPKIVKGHITAANSGWSWYYELAIGETYIAYNSGGCRYTHDYFSPVVPKIKLSEPNAAWGSDKAKWQTLKTNGAAAIQNKQVVPVSQVSRVFHYTAKFVLHTITVLHTGGKFTFLVDGTQKIEAKSKGGCCCFGSCGQEDVEVEFTDTANESNPEKQIKFICKMTWKPNFRKETSMWSYLLEAHVQENGRKDILYPIFGSGGVGGTPELWLGDKIGLKPYNLAFASVTYDTSTILAEDAKKGESRIVIEKQGEAFVKDDIIKIEGQSESDPQTFHKIKAISGKTMEFYGTIQCDKRAAGSKVVKVAKAGLPQKGMEDKVEEELRYIMGKRLRVNDSQWGLRFAPGEAKMKYEAWSAAVYDIPQLLDMFPFYEIKIVGYTGKNTANDIYKTQNDLKYLATKRCEIVAHLLNEAMMQYTDGKRQRLIGIQGKGWDGEDTIYPSCCLIEQSTKEEIEKMNAESQEFVRMMEEQATDKRFFIKTTREVNLSYGHDVDAGEDKWHVVATQGGVPSALADQNPEDHSSNVMNNFSGAAVTGQTTSNMTMASNNTIEKSGRWSVHQLQQNLSTPQKDVIRYYGPDQELEFFSRTHRKWLRCNVTRVAVDEELAVHRWTAKGIEWAKGRSMSMPLDGELVTADQAKVIGSEITNHENFLLEDARCFYDVIFTRSKKLRHMVEIESLRRPLCSDENECMVEIYSKKGAGKWIPGVMRGATAAGTTVGYTVYATINSKEEKLDSVPAERIRRRFPGGARVEFFHGSKYGWQPAKVATSAGDGCSKGKQGSSTGGVTDLDWVLAKPSDNETVLKIIGSNLEVEKRQEQQNNLAHQTAINEEALEDEELVAEASDDQQLETTTAKGAKAAPEAVSDGVILEPWTSVPIEIDEKVLKELKITASMPMRIESYRLRNAAK